MASGRVELASVGIQDLFLSGDPQFTYFLKQYKKHTKFAMELMDNPFDGTSVINSTTFGTTITCTVPRKGDLIRTMFVKIELSAGEYVDSVGNAIIDYADLVIGGQTIQRITGEYMELYSDLYVSASQQSCLSNIVGRNGSGSVLVPTGTTRTFIVPLPFYFYRNNNLAIPLAAITRQEVQVRLKLKSFSDVIYNRTSTVGGITSVSLPVEYVFLSQEEIKYIKGTKIDYVVSQLQLNRQTMNRRETTAKVVLQFVNPVRELFIVLQDSYWIKDDPNAVDSHINQPFNYQYPSTVPTAREYEKIRQPLGDALVKASLTFNNETRFSDEIANAIYLRKVQPLEYHTRTPDRYFYTYSFALDPENPQPSGQVNMSRIINKVLNITTKPVRTTQEIRVYATSYNILRVQNGLAGCIFIDNNFI
jgi:hypothetical protein